MPEQQFHDDAAILDRAILWRRIPPAWVVWDGNLGRMRSSSQAFQDHPDGSPMSVLLSDMMLSSGRGPEAAIEGLPGFYLASLTAGLARQSKQGVAPDPLPTEPAHAVVFGKKTSGVRNRFATESQWVIPPIENRQ